MAENWRPTTGDRLVMALTGQTGQNQGSRVPAGFEVRAVPRWPKSGPLFILCISVDSRKTSVVDTALHRR